MVTGDNLLTAKSIAKECGIIKEEKINNNGKNLSILTGKEF